MAYNNGNFAFCDIPPHYKSMLGQVSDRILRKFYDNFSFLYLHLENYDYDKDQISNLILSDFLKDTKFLTYKIERLKNIKNDGLSNEMGNAIICIENQCLIIESIKINFLCQIIKSANSYFIDASSPIPEEIDFCEEFQYLIFPNRFVQYTIHPILAYLIKRFYYPSYIFKDQSFFEFDHLTSSKTNIDDLKVLTEKSKYCDLTNEDRLNMIKNKINSQNKYTIIDFKEDDFIKLKLISSTNPKVAYHLVMHINSLHIFTMKTITTRDDKGIQHEIEFCKNYSHRCIIKFYGFIKKDQNIAGFIYEFMSNGNLYENMKRNISEIESFTIINRIFQAVDYLHSNHLINRDIKPSNILFDHNNVPYMSDLETIRNIDDNNSNKESFSFDIGTEMYSSPEQDKGESISYSTDYFSFGLVVYYLFEKKEIKNSSQLKENRIEFPPLNNGPKSIQYLYQRCVKINPKERLTKNEIYSILLEETKKLTFFDNFKISYDLFNVTELIHYFFENLMLIISNSSNINWKNDNIIIWYSKFYVNYLSNLKSDDFSSFLFLFGVLYDKGFGVDQNNLKAKSYHELSIKQNNANSLLALGAIYINEGNYAKGKELIELSAKQNNDDALYNLGILNLEQKNFSEAIQNFEMAAELKHPQALFVLGSMYYNGQVVEKDQSKAFKYYNLAAELKDIDAILELGYLYLEKQDYEKIKRII